MHYQVSAFSKTPFSLTLAHYLTLDPHIVLEPLLTSTTSLLTSLFSS